MEYISHFLISDDMVAIGTELKIFLLRSGKYVTTFVIINPKDNSHKFSNALVNQTAKEPKREHHGLPTNMNVYIHDCGW